MKMYADAPVRRTVQILTDILVLGWVLAWWAVARAVHRATLQFAEPGERLSSAGNGLAGRLRQAGADLGDLPLVGERVRAPFDGAAQAASAIARAGEAQAEAVESLAFWLALSVGSVPILLVLALHLPQRWRFAREATAGRRLADRAEDIDLFALRALARQPMHRLARVSDDPAGDWRRRDPQVIARLAGLELRDSGLSIGAGERDGMSASGPR